MWWIPLALAEPLPSIDPPLRTGVSAPGAAVVIGAAEYTFVPDAPGAVPSAHSLADALHHTVGIPAARVQRLVGAVDRAAILAAVDRAAAMAETGRVWVTFVGHGVPSPITGATLWLGAETPADPTSVDGWGVSVSEVIARASALGAQVVVIAETADPGISLGSVPQQVPAATSSALIWTAPHTAPPGSDRGIFPHFVVGALRGWADGELGAYDGRVTSQEAMAYVDRVFVARGGVAPEASGPPQWVLSLGTEGDPTGPPRPVLPGPVLAAGQAELARRRDATGVDRRRWAAVDWAALGPAPTEAQLLDYLDRYGIPDDGVVAPQVPYAVAALAGTPRPTTGSGTPFTTLEVIGGRVRYAGKRRRIPDTLLVARTEVTQGQWAAVMASDPLQRTTLHLREGVTVGDRCAGAGIGADLPVVCVDLYDAAAFCNALSSAHGLQPAYHLEGSVLVLNPSGDGWRLPTGLEWAYFAASLPGEVRPAESCGVGNLADVPSVCEDGAVTLAAVGSFSVEERWSLLDLVGNVAEIVWPVPFGQPDWVPLTVDSQGIVEVKGASFGSDIFRRDVLKQRPGIDRAMDQGFRVVRRAP